MSTVDDDRFISCPGRQARPWEAHFHRLYCELRTVPHEPIELIRASLLSPQTRTARRERLLISLIDHPDQRATALLDHPDLYLERERQRFICRLARRRRRGHLRRQPRPAVVAA